MPPCCVPEGEQPIDALIVQEPRGVNLVGKVTNFYWYYDVWHGPQIEERHVCRVPSGGCGQGGCKTGTQKMG